MTRFRVLKTLLVTIAIVCGLGLLAALAIRIYGAHRLAEVSKRYEREVGPLSLEGFVRPRIAVEKNAVTWQRPGALAAVFFPRDMDVVGRLTTKRFTEWTAEDTAQLEAILERNTPSLTLLDRSRGMREANWEIPYEQGTTAKIPNLMAAINAAKMLNARGRLALGRGDRETALASGETLGALARSHEAESSLIMLLIGLAIEKLQLALVNDFVSAPGATPAELDRLEASLCDADLKGPVRSAIRGAAAANVRDVHAEAILDAVHNPFPLGLSSVLADLVAAEMIEASRDAEKDVFEPVKAPLVEAGSENSGGGWRARVRAVIGQNLATASARSTAIASARELAHIAIALRRESLASGRYPENLPAIAGIPAIDPLTGGPRAYVVKGDGSAALRSTTTAEIYGSISPGGKVFYDSLFTWMLPARR
jgi:hypothetical protein